MFWDFLLLILFLLAAVISALALMSGNGHPHSRRRTH
jgi:hypothetical protein